MAFVINSTSVITDALALSNIASLDQPTADAVAYALMTQNTLVTGTTIRASRDAEVTSPNEYRTHSWWSFIQKGTVNFYFEARVDAAGSAGGAVVEFRRTRNNATSTIFTQSITGTTYTGFNTNVSILPGDYIQVYIKGTVLSKSAVYIYCRNFRLRTAADSALIPVYNMNDGYFSYFSAY